MFVYLQQSMRNATKNQATSILNIILNIYFRYFRGARRPFFLLLSKPNDLNIFQIKTDRDS